MKIFISALAFGLFSLSFASCASHQSCPAYSQSIQKGMNIDTVLIQEIVELETENV